MSTWKRLLGKLAPTLLAGVAGSAALAQQPPPAPSGQLPLHPTELRLVMRSHETMVERDALLTRLNGVDSNLVRYAVTPSIDALLVADKGMTSLQLDRDALARAAIDQAAAIAAGRQQVLSVLPGLPSAEDISASGVLVSPRVDYVASLILRDGWDELAAQLDGTMVVAVPSDDRLIIAVLNPDRPVEQLRAYVEGEYAEASRSVSRALLVRRGGRWVELD